MTRQLVRTSVVHCILSSVYPSTPPLPEDWQTRGNPVGRCEAVECGAVMGRPGGGGAKNNIGDEGTSTCYSVHHEPGKTACVSLLPSGTDRNGGVPRSRACGWCGPGFGGRRSALEKALGGGSSTLVTLLKDGGTSVLYLRPWTPSGQRDRGPQWVAALCSQCY